MPEGSVPLPLAVRVMDYDWGKKVVVMHTPSPVEYVPLLWVLKVQCQALNSVIWAC